MRRSAQSSKWVDRRVGGFTLVELLIVIGIIVLLMSVLLPALAAVRQRAKKLATRAQLQSLVVSSDAYFFDFSAYPGYLANGDWQSNDVANYLTSTENVVVSLMGGAVDSGGDMSVSGASATLRIEFDNVGDGPEINGKQYGAYYAPKAGEMAKMSGAANTNNQMPEIITAESQVPILCFRADRSGTSPAGQKPSNGGVFTWVVHKQYIRSAALKSPNGKEYDQLTKAWMGNNGTGATGGVALIALMAINEQLSPNPGTPNDSDNVLRGAMIFHAPGRDGIYFDKSTLKSDAFPSDQDDLEEYDDLVVTGGSL